MPPAPRPPLLKQELDRIAAERQDTERQANRARRWELLRACLECIGWCFTGLVLMAVGFHVSNRLEGEVWLYLGMIVGYGGIVGSLIAAYRRGEKRGDW